MIDTVGMITLPEEMMGCQYASPMGLISFGMRTGPENGEYIDCTKKWHAVLTIPNPSRRGKPLDFIRRWKRVLLSDGFRYRHEKKQGLNSITGFMVYELVLATV